MFTMMHGCVDAITSSGYVEGWAWDSEQPTHPIIVSVVDHRAQEIAWGLAHRYRKDLVVAGCGIGWCAFRLRVTVTIHNIIHTKLTLLSRQSRQKIYSADPVSFIEDGDITLSSITDVTNSDPTILNTIDQLRGCENILATFIKRHGVDAFVRASYVYILGRAADISGRNRYGRLLRQGVMTPFTLLLTLSESDEFRSRPRLLSPPNRSGFPFHAT